MNSLLHQVFLCSETSPSPPHGYSGLTGPQPRSEVSSSSPSTVPCPEAVVTLQEAAGTGAAAACRCLGLFLHCPPLSIKLLTPRSPHGCSTAWQSFAGSHSGATYPPLDVSLWLCHSPLLQKAGASAACKAPKLPLSTRKVPV